MLIGLHTINYRYIAGAWMGPYELLSFSCIQQTSMATTTAASKIVCNPTNIPLFNSA